MRMIFAIPFVAVVAACGALDPGSQQSDPGPTAAQRETTYTRTASVKAVDQATREVSLQFDDGEAKTIVAGPEVRNLAQLEPGDIVVIDYLESVALEMTEAEVSDAATAAVFAERAPEGAKPGASAAAGVSMVVELVSYDAASGVATYIAPGGGVEKTEVNPALREFAEARKPGERVELTLIRAKAISIVEKSR